MTKELEESQNLQDDLTTSVPHKVEELQLSLLPSTENKEISDIISTERNFDKWANFIFPHTKSADLKEIRKKEWEIELPNGKFANASILITPAKEGRCYTARTYDVYLALIWFWREFGMPETPFKLTLSQIAKKLELPTSGKNLKSIQDELQVLYFTNISWVLSFQDNAEKHMTTKNQRVLDTFNYITLEERGGVSGQSGVTLQFNENIRKNIRNNVTTPVNFTARKSIRSSVAKILYGRIDSILATNPKLERRIENLVVELNLTESRYQYKSQRKILGELLVENLNGLELSNLNKLTVELAETSDQKDYKLIFKAHDSKKAKRKTGNESSSSDRLKVVNTDKDLIAGLVFEMKNLIGDKGQKNDGLYHSIARYYSETLIYRAIGEFKELITLNPRIGNRSAYFTTVVHVIAHKMGKEWIKECGSSCRYRPENQFLPE